MSDDSKKPENKSAEPENMASEPQDLIDNELDDAQGGFSLSGSFTQTQTFTTQISNPNTTKIDQNTLKLNDKDTSMLRTRPGRIGNPFGG